MERKNEQIEVIQQKTKSIKIMTLNNKQFDKQDGSG